MDTAISEFTPMEIFDSPVTPAAEKKRNPRIIWKPFATEKKGFNLIFKGYAPDQYTFMRPKSALIHLRESSICCRLVSLPIRGLAGIEKSFIFSFKEGKISVYRKDRGMIKHYPLTSLISGGLFNVMFDSLCPLRHSFGPEEVKQRFKKRFMKLFRSMARKNKCKIPKSDNLGECIFWNRYPALRPLSRQEWSKILILRRSFDSPFYSKKLLGSEIKDYPRILFKTKGKRLRKLFFDWFAEEETVRPSFIFPFRTANLIARQFKDENHVYTFLEKRKALSSRYIEPVPYSKLISQFTAKKIINILAEGNESQIYLYRDSCRIYNELIKNKQDLSGLPKNDLNEIHGFLSDKHRKMKIPEAAVKPSPLMKYLDGTKFRDYEIVYPKTNYELTDWGTKLHNCISSYFRYINSRQTQIFGLKKDGEIKFAAEADPENKLRQFSGCYNHPVEPDMFNEFQDVLSKSAQKMVDKEDCLTLAGNMLGLAS